MSAASAHAARTTGARVRRLTTAQGAGTSGLSRLIELHVVHAAGDALIAISLAGTLFFSVPSGEARGRVAIYLLVTMLPFSVLAPFIGPFLDRFRHGRRWAIGATTALRGFLSWVMASAVGDEGLSLYPAAFGCLVASRAYSVTRAAAVPRLAPDGVSLVTANSRVSLAGVAGVSVAAPIGLGLASLGPQWSLRFAFLVFVLATVLAIRLPGRLDSTVGEEELEPGPVAGLRRAPVGPAVVGALRGNAALRGFSGLLTMFLAFLLREEPVAGLSATMAIGVVALSAGLGSTSGTSLGAAVPLTRPDAVIAGLLAVAAGAALVAALLYGLPTVIIVAVAAGFAQSLGRLCLDSVVQRDVRESVRTSAFARAETLLQLSWVAGGLVGIVLPLEPRLGFGVATTVLVTMLVAVLRARRAQPPAPGPVPPTTPT